MEELYQFDIKQDLMLQTKKSYFLYNRIEKFRKCKWSTYKLPPPPPPSLISQLTRKITSNNSKEVINIKQNIQSNIERAFANKLVVRKGKEIKGMEK